jgi:hypothetical protein
MGGDPTITHPVQVNGKVVNVTTNLAAALRQLAAEANRGPLVDLWVDALGINQADLDDKNYQVPMMGEIYSSALDVIVWLGESDVTTGPFYALLEAVTQKEASPGPPTEAHLANLIKAHILATSTLLRPYWRRIWIEQEVALAKNIPRLLCGKYLVNFMDFTDGIIRIWDSCNHMDHQSAIWNSMVDECKLADRRPTSCAAPRSLHEE